MLTNIANRFSSSMFSSTYDGIGMRNMVDCIDDIQRKNIEYMNEAAVVNYMSATDEWQEF